MRRRMRYRLLAAGICGCAVIIAICLAASRVVGPFSSVTRKTEAEQSGEKQETPRPKADNVVVPGKDVPLTRRVPVAGSPGHFVVIEADGSMHMESPKGTTVIVSPMEASQPSDAEIEKLLMARLANARKELPGLRRPSGKLFVLEKGIVDIPEDAIITLVETDRLVIIEDDDNSVVYYADGRIERREARPKTGVKGMP